MKLLIDCCSIGYKIAYGMPALSYDGSNTHIIFGFLKQLIVLAEKFNTGQFIFCWDSRQSYRKEFDPEYKRRDVKPEQKALIDDARRQFNLLYNDVLPMMGFRNVFLFSGYEADDLLAWICMRLPDEYMIVSGDEDLYQLLLDTRTYSIRFYDIKKERMFTAADFKAKYGIKPMQWANVKGMGGCPSDKVSGIPGVGPESAIKYLNGVLKDGKIKSKIESPEGKRQFRDSFYLVALPFPGDRPIKIELVDAPLYSMDFLDAFRKYGCGSLEKDIAQWKKLFNLVSGR
jgi:DNA polymerase-1